MLRWLVLILIVWSPQLKAQELLTLQQAIELSLKNNYDILMVRNDAKITSNNVSLGNAGALPVVDFVLDQNNSILDSRQNYSNGTEVSKTGATGHSVSSQVQLNWTLFDGFRMFASYNKLKQLEAAGNLNVKATIEATVNEVINTYYEIVRMNALLNVTRYALDVSQVKLDIARTRFEIGKTSKSEYLQAEVDRNADSSSLLQQQQTLDNSKVRLNELLAREADMLFNVDTTIEVDPSLTLENLQSLAEKENTSLLLAENEVGISRYYLKEVRADRYPRIGVNGSYIYNKSSTEASFVLDNRTSGFNYGFTITYNLFNGFNLNREIENAKTINENAMVNYTATKANVFSQLRIGYRVYVNNIQLMNLEQANSALANENLELALARFRVGSIDELRLKDAQQSNVEAENRLVNARFIAKLSEVYLKRITGQLLK